MHLNWERGSFEDFVGYRYWRRFVFQEESVALRFIQVSFNTVFNRLTDCITFAPGLQSYIKQTQQQTCPKISNSSAHGFILAKWVGRTWKILLWRYCVCISKGRVLLGPLLGGFNVESTFGHVRGTTSCACAMARMSRHYQTLRSSQLD